MLILFLLFVLGILGRNNESKKSDFKNRDYRLVEDKVLRKKNIYNKNFCFY